ncbi:3055_t:CDS:1, partial [Gigaspora rosea]
FVNAPRVLSRDQTRTWTRPDVRAYVPKITISGYWLNTNNLFFFAIKLLNPLTILSVTGAITGVVEASIGIRQC